MWEVADTPWAAQAAQDPGPTLALLLGKLCSPGLSQETRKGPVTPGAEKESNLGPRPPRRVCWAHTSLKQDTWPEESAHMHVIWPQLQTYKVVLGGRGGV